MDTTDNKIEKSIYAQSTVGIEEGKGGLEERVTKYEIRQNPLSPKGLVGEVSRLREELIKKDPKSRVVVYNLLGRKIKQGEVDKISSGKYFIEIKSPALPEKRKTIQVIVFREK